MMRSRPPSSACSWCSANRVAMMMMMMRADRFSFVRAIHVTPTQPYIRHVALVCHFSFFKNCILSFFLQNKYYVVYFFFVFSNVSIWSFDAFYRKIKFVLYEYYHKPLIKNRPNSQRHSSNMRHSLTSNYYQTHSHRIHCYHYNYQNNTIIITTMMLISLSDAIFQSEADSVAEWSGNNGNLWCIACKDCI